MKPFLIILLLFAQTAFAQDDILSSLLDSGVVQREKVSATFKTTRIINIQSNETVHKRTLDFRVAHRFGAIGEKSGGNAHNMYGLYNASDIRIAFEYGITDRLTAGIARYKVNENYEGLLKYRLLHQTNDNHIPVAITLFGNMTYSAEENALLDFDNPSLSTEYIRRISYFAQAVIARKFSPRFSVALAPSFIHRNFVENFQDENNLFAMGIGGRLKITRSMAVIADYVYNFSSMREIDNIYGYYNPLGLGVEFETGGHVFSIMFTNAEAVLENDFIPDTRSSWEDGGMRFSFNISRNFRL